MSLWTRLLSLLESIFGPLLAWRYDRIEEPSNLTAKRRELVDIIPRAAAVLEIGAGTGQTLTSGAYEASAGRFSRLVLLEPDRSMRARLSSKLDGRATGVSAGELVVVDAALPELPFEGGEFDAVLIFFVLSHVERRVEGMAEIARVLKPGGKLLFLDHGLHEHAHNQHDGRENEHGHGHGHGGYTSFLMEWLMFWRHKHNRDNVDLDGLVDVIRGDSRLDEVFVGKATCSEYFFNEVAYGCFERKQDPDS